MVSNPKIQVDSDPSNSPHVEEAIALSHRLNLSVTSSFNFALSLVKITSGNNNRPHSRRTPVIHIHTIPLTASRIVILPDIKILGINSLEELFS
jgi:hypothetical protein